MSSELESRLVKASRYYPNLGWKLLPCHGIDNGRCTCGKTHQEPKEVGKHPVLNQWNTESTSDIDKINKWWTENPEYNIGVHCSKSGLLVIDIDPRSGGPDSLVEFEKMVEGGLPDTVEAITGNHTSTDGTGSGIRGRHIYYRCSPDEALIGNLGNLGLKGVDIKHNGYVLVAPSRHFSGVTYEWAEGKAPWEMEITEAPEALLDVLRKRKRRTSLSIGNGEWDWIKDVKSEKVDYAKVLEEGLEEGNRAVGIYELGCHLANKYGTDPQSASFIETYMIRFNAEKVKPPMEIEGPNSVVMHVRRAIDFVAENPKFKDPAYDEWQKKVAIKASKQGKETIRAITGVVQPPSEDESVTAETYASYLDEVNRGVQDSGSIASASSVHRAGVVGDPDSVTSEDGGQLGSRTLTDTGNGRRLVDVFGSGVRYTPGLGWFIWKDGFWKTDSEDLEVKELAKRLNSYIKAEIPYREGEDENLRKWANQSKSNARIAGAVESAKSDPRSLVDVDTWDQDDYLLGVKNGVINLKTGELLKGRPDLHITRRAPVSYTSGHRNSRWEKFLDEATNGDKEYQDWLQKAAGYTLTGSNNYDLMFLVYGPAGSGKNTFVEAIVKCLGSQQYAWPLDSSILAQDGGSNGNSDMYHWAQLRGRRMVWVDELPESERIKENSVKKLTGSSEISARSPGEQPFTFASQAKLWVSTNHRPIITDDAMWRRIRPIPFDSVPTEPDPGLKEYIFDPEGALPAVLAWAVEGAIKLLNSKEIDALGWCKRVREAAEIYRKNEDRIGIFLSEECTAGPEEKTTIKSLYSVYRIWSEDRGERPMTQIAFTRKMSDRGAKVEGTGSKAIVRGYSTLNHMKTQEATQWSHLTQRASF